MASSKVTHVTDGSFQEEVLSSDLPVLVDFWAPWCGPCRALSPVLDQLAEEYDGKVKIVKVNSDEAIETAAAHRVRALPTLVVFKGGSENGRIVGAVPRAKLNALIQQAL